jgi:FlaA1/EpsC-like NDP-sugar epimerase
MKNNNMFNIKRLLAIAHDIVACLIAWVLAYQLRFNFAIPFEHSNVMQLYLLWILLVQILSFFVMGLYRGVWRFASLIDLQRIILSILLSSVIFWALLIILKLPFVVPRSVLIIDPAVLILLMGGSRFLYRAIKERKLYLFRSSEGEPIVIFGTDQTAVSLAKELILGRDWRVVGFISKDASLHNREISGIKIIGVINDLPKLKLKFGISKLIIAHLPLDHHERRFILSQSQALGINVLTIPSVDDLMSGRLNASKIRPVDVEDLLGRDSVVLDNSRLTSFIRGEVVLVTGAGGSIGSELCRQIIKFNPKTLVCLDISEIALYKIEQEFFNLKFQNNIYVIADVKNKERLREIFNQFKPKIVFHAAAYKHVPLMETCNVSEALINNAMGTYHIAQIAKDFKVNKFILVSTDKAVNPTNVMGASKYLAEVICRGLQLKSKTDFVITRFGNVLGSSGSVIPKFRKQIAAGGPVTVTHPEMTRYFMSIPEAAQLVMQASLMGKSGQIYVLDMGESVKIVDLARDMIKLSGFDENDIKIKFTGLRPGEKLYEELLNDNEAIMPTTHPKLKVATSENISEKKVKDLIKWILSTTSKTEVQIKKELKLWVKGYSVKVKRIRPTKT